MKSLRMKGKTVDQAIFNGLKEMQMSIDEVEIEIIQEGNKGFLGIGKSAVVELREKQGLGREVEDFLNGLFQKMHIGAKCTASEESDYIKANITGDSSGILIGRRGETLDAIQYLASLVVNKDREDYKKIMVDTENYRQKREETLVRLANRLAAKVEKTGKKVSLEPMNPYERRILHATLQSNPKVETYSEGEEPFRRIVIKKKYKAKA